MVLDCLPALSSMTRMRLHANAREASRACVVVGGQLAVSVVMGGQLAVRASWWAVSWRLGEASVRDLVVR